MFKYIADLGYPLRNISLPASCTLLYNIMYIVCNTVLYTVLYTILYTVMSIITLEYTLEYTNIRVTVGACFLSKTLLSIIMLIVWHTILYNSL